VLAALARAARPLHGPADAARAGRTIAGSAPGRDPAVGRASPPVTG
jgi:hypothetical protein